MMDTLGRISTTQRRFAPTVSAIVGITVRNHRNTHLSRRGRLHAWDIGAGLWLDVDTPQALIRGEEMLRRGLFAVGSPGFAAALERRGVGA
jgi:hypothetical protein